MVKHTTTNILSLNLNSIRSHNKQGILQRLLKQWDVDIALFQEVACLDLPLQEYELIMNADSTLGTAVAIKRNIEYCNVIKSPDSRAIAVTVENTKIINIYATGSQAKMKEIFSLHKI